MNYELAKQLKDAGFKLPDSHYIECEYERHDSCKPTLSELIEECGDELILMCVNKITYYSFKFADNKIFGSTPEEAVAKLWLELNKK